MVVRREEGIYRIHCRPIDWNYVGSAAMGFSERWRGHWLLLERGTHHNKALQKDWLRFGEMAFTFSILEIVPDAHRHHWWLIRRERYWIAQAQKAGGCYNRPLSSALCPECGSYRKGKWAWPFMCYCVRRKEA
jgi:group I intron endonuclease